MDKRNIFFIVILILLINSSFSLAAIIHGSVYDMNLEKVKGVILEVNSNPKQRIISTTGDYSFSLPNGAYNITAVYNDKSGIQKGNELINITSDGNFTLDLFLFTDISNEESLANTQDINFQTPFKEVNYLPYLIIILLLVIAVLVLLTRLFLLRKNEKSEIVVVKFDSNTNDPINKLLKLIEKSDGRITQKEIRKEFPLSEAKISLMIAELESSGKIQKIKKGRGNIIVLKKDK